MANKTGVRESAQFEDPSSPEWDLYPRGNDEMRSPCC